MTEPQQAQSVDSPTQPPVHPQSNSGKPATAEEVALTADGEHQLRLALEHVQQAFQLQRQQAQQELQHWKTLATQQRHQLVAMETEVQQLVRKLQDSDARNRQYQEELVKARDAKSVLVEKYQQLRQSALQLETFRKQILSMLDFGPKGLPLDTQDLSFLDYQQQLQPGSELATATTTGQSAPQPLITGPSLSFAADVQFHDHHQQPTVQAQQSEQLGAAHPPPVSDEGTHQVLHLTPFKPDTDPLLKDVDHSPVKQWIANKKQQQQQQQQPGALKSSMKSPPSQPPLRASVNNQNHHSHPVKSTSNTLTMDAPKLYKRIRQQISPAEFDQFATDIAQFNAGTQSAEDTIRKLSELVKDVELVEQMRLLIQRAVDEQQQHHQSHNNLGRSSVGAQ